MTCPRCLGLGWQCEDHDAPMHHRLPSGEECGGAGKPCEHPGCPDSGKRDFDQIIASTSTDEDDQ